MNRDDQDYAPCNCRGEMVMQDLFVCYARHTECQYRFPYGYGFYCCLRLKEAGMPRRPDSIAGNSA